MSQQTPTSHSIYGRFREEIEGFDSLVELASDMRWSWNHSTDEASSSSTSVGMPRRSLALPFTICWPLAARTQPTRQSISTWRVWQSAGAGRRMA